MGGRGDEGTGGWSTVWIGFYVTVIKKALWGNLEWYGMGGGRVENNISILSWVGSGRWGEGKGYVIRRTHWRGIFETLKGKKIHGHTGLCSSTLGTTKDRLPYCTLEYVITQWAQ